MKIGSKILTGAAATLILALVGHAATGEKFISGLEQKAQTELAARGLDSASVSLDRDPLSRGAILHGAVTDDVKQDALNVVMAIPGVSGASWKGVDSFETDGGGSAAPVSTAADQDKVAKCQADVDKIIQTKNISFRSGSAYLSLETKQILDQLTAALQACEGLSITVEGHTDDNGDSEVNLIMSQERADRIKTGLVERGIPEALITAKAFGSTQPLVTGSDAAADAQNRRIAVRVAAASSPSPIDAKAPQQNSSMPLLLENLLLLLVTFAIGLAIGWFIWGRNDKDY
ncbi:OmpA family protein [Parasphingorhabdus sp.]|jgi:OOP family OmpA-OmpF porin|uniref:OmpA family protein n=1 Tax=Parasphingorhabdus sp. TaxID=2709688 RepID=UPI0030AEDDAD|nr:OmpA family protein [Sphingomonadales bacterium]